MKKYLFTKPDEKQTQQENIQRKMLFVEWVTQQTKNLEVRLDNDSEDSDTDTDSDTSSSSTSSSSSSTSTSKSSGREVASHDLSQDSPDEPELPQVRVRVVDAATLEVGHSTPSSGENDLRAECVDSQLAETSLKVMQSSSTTKMELAAWCLQKMKDSMTSHLDSKAFPKQFQYFHRCLRLSSSSVNAKRGSAESKRRKRILFENMSTMTKLLSDNSLHDHTCIKKSGASIDPAMFSDSEDVGKSTLSSTISSTFRLPVSSTTSSTTSSTESSTNSSTESSTYRTVYLPI